MPNTILLKRSSTASSVPAAASLQAGELAVNLADQKLYSKTTGGAVVQVGFGNLSSAMVTTALGFTPANKAGDSFAGSISVSGPITATGDITAYSDARLKTDIETIADALDRVRKLRGVTFIRRDTGGRGIGVVAQDLAPIVPEAVLTHDDGLLSVAYGNLVGLLIEAVKELAEQGNSHAHAIAKLEARP